MAWAFNDDQSEIVRDGATYVVRDMGAGGHCLFLSLSLVLALAGETERSYADLRSRAVDRLIAWVVDGVPDWFGDQQYEAPTAERVGALAVGDWGDVTSMLALLDHSYENVRIVILNASDRSVLDDDEITVDVSVRGAAVQRTVFILWVGGNHYQAVVPKDIEDRIEAARLRLVVLAPVPAIGLSTKLSTVSGLSTALNTRAEPGTGLEIHQINVGIGDAALILVKEKGNYVQSILIDCGRFPDLMAGYFDDLIRQKRFRPVDVFIASHYDADHIGAAPDVLRNKIYANQDIVLHDPGVPGYSPESDYAEYQKAFGEPNTKRRVTADLEQPVYNRGGVVVRIVAMNGLVRSGKDGAYRSLNEAIAGPVPKAFLSGQMTKTQVLQSGLSHMVLLPPSANQCSLAVLVEFGSFRYYTAGDLNGRYEDEVATHVATGYLNNGKGHVCACKLNHHGAHEATSPWVLQALRPRLCLVSCGTPNRYGHPSDVMLDRVTQLHARYPSDVMVTANLAVDPKVDGIPWARPPLEGHVQHDRGSIVMLMDAAMVGGEKHGFVVLSSADSTPRFLTCGDRPYDKDLNIKDRKEKPKQSAQRKADSAARKRKRKIDREEDELDALKAVRSSLEARLGGAIDANIEDASVRGAMHTAMQAQLDALALRLVDPDEVVQDQRVGTLAKNFGKELNPKGQCSTPLGVTAYLSAHQPKKH